jgi:hypothetical protein
MGIINGENAQTTVEYKITLEQIKELIAKDLGVPVEQIRVDYKLEDTSDDRMGGYPSYGVTGVNVTHTKK